MMIIHRVSLQVSSDVQRSLASAGLGVEQGFVSFEIDESDARWPAVSQLVDRVGAVDIVSTQFSNQEIATATALQMAPSWHWGYPQPKEDFGYLELTYDLANYCPTCGVGLRQKAPFRLSGEPRWGSRHLLQLNWVFDEFFIRPEKWEEVFQPLGIGHRPVLNAATGRELTSVVQLTVSYELAADVPATSRAACVACGRVKYEPHTRGRLPYINLKGVHAAKTEQYFGSGTSAWKAIVVSAELCERVRRASLKGVEFVPVEERD